MATPAATSLALAVVLLLVAFTAGAGAATFSITNRCPFPVCAAAMPVTTGGGAQLAPGETWTLTFAVGGTGGRIWQRTGCAFDPATGREGCQTSDCGGALRCVLSGKPPPPPRRWPSSTSRTAAPRAGTAYRSSTASPCHGLLLQRTLRTAA
ncbi:hypothetical protein VPH35_060080 [Triticum aestivum]